MALPLIPIIDAHARKRVRLSGVIQSVTYVPVTSPAKFTAILSDGTASIELRWPGRRDVTGISVGQTVEVEGTVMPATDQHVIIHPLYRIMSHD